ncbi:MAG: hypothetical protein V4617_14145, partial [Gemmatimonadota bacterium]
LPAPRAARAVPRAEVQDDAPADDAAPAVAAPAVAQVPDTRPVTVWSRLPDDAQLLRGERGVMLAPEESD